MIFPFSFWKSLVALVDGAIRTLDIRHWAGPFAEKVIPSASAIPGQAFVFTGAAGKAIQLNSVPNSNTDNFTLCFWFYPNTVNPAANGIIIFNGVTGSNGYGMGIRATGVLDFEFGGITGDVTGYTFTTPNEWYFIVFRRASGVSGFKVNNVSTSATPATTPNAPATKFTVGSYNDLGFPCNGRVDQVSAFNVALSDTQLTQLYNSGSGMIGNPTGASANLEWRADGDTLDSSGNGRDGTNNGSVTYAAGQVGAAPFVSTDIAAMDINHRAGPFVTYNNPTLVP